MNINELTPDQLEAYCILQQHEIDAQGDVLDMQLLEIKQSRLVASALEIKNEQAKIKSYYEHARDLLQ